MVRYYQNQNLFDLNVIENDFENVICVQLLPRRGHYSVCAFSETELVFVPGEPH